jgi:multisubunit Na+/H+ antiporter MnhB subunit
MGFVLHLFPYLAFPALILVSAVVGLHLLLTSREVLMERYQALVYNLTHEQLEDLDRRQCRKIVWSSRMLGAFAMLFSAGMVMASYAYFFAPATGAA